MPSEDVMPLYRAHKLHSGRGKNGKKGKIVRSKAQAKAILLSYLRKEGHNIPKKGSRKKHSGRKKVTVKR